MYDEQARGAKALLWAAENGQESTVKMAIAGARRRGGAGAVAAVMQSLNSKGDTAALALAAQGNHVHVAKLLLETEGVDVMHRENPWSCSPLEWAAQKGSLDVIRLLLADARVDPNNRGFFDQTALYWAATCGSAEAADLLLKDGRVDT